MSVLADFLGAQTGAIAELFTRRLRATIARDTLTRSELINHLPDFLVEIAAALRETGQPGGHAFSSSPTAQEHGRQRLRIGYNLDALVREYGLLGDSLFEHMREVGLQPSLGELQILTGRLAAGVADATEHYVEERQRAFEAESLQRRAAEAAMTSSNERFHTLFEALDDGCCVVEILRDVAGKAVDYRFVEVNPAFEVHFGLH